MRRLAAQFVGLALCTTALTGCGMMGGDNSGAPPAEHAGDNTPIATDTTAALRQAQLMRTGGDLVGATRILSQLMLGAPDDPRIVGEYGKLLVQQRQPADAVQFLRRAIELQPSDWTLYSALGVAYDQLSDQANAKMAYEHALALKPGEPAILNNFAMSRMLAGDNVAARTLMMQARASGSNDPKIAQNLALLDSKLLVAPATQAAPPSAVAMAPRAPALASNGFPPVAPPAQGAPTPISAAPRPITHGGGQVVMQDVPVDPLAGPVAARGGHPAKPSKPAPRLARTDKPKPKPAHALAANTPPKPAKPAKPDARDHIPALRMTADAGKP